MATKKTSPAKRAAKKTATKKWKPPGKPVKGSRATPKAGSSLDASTKAGRDAIDKAVRKELHATKGKTRSEIATALGTEPRWISASLLRLQDASQARSEGERANTRWFRSEVEA
jgi:hypothetical protein